MSSTNRGSDRNRNDLYETPEWVTHLLFQRFPHFGGEILECAVGKGKMMRVIEQYNKKVIGLDVNPDFNPDICCDFRGYKPTYRFDNVITNPPFIHAIEFVKKALEITKEGGSVAMLLRLNFIESRKRYKFFKDNMPHTIMVLSERPKFANNKTDSIAYAWFIWKKGLRERESKMLLVSKDEVQ